MGDAPRIRFIVNPFAGPSREDIGSVIRGELCSRGIDFELFWTRRPGHATELARGAADEGDAIVAAVGGDGTVNEVASALVGKGAALGIIPRGSGNGLARSLGIPLDPRGACRVLSNGAFRRIDVGRVDGRYFVATAGIGLDACVAAKYAGRPPEKRGILPYVMLTLGAFFTYLPEEIRLTLDDAQPITARPLLLTVANVREFGGGAVIAPNARPDDGLLDVCLMEDITLFRALLHAHRLFTGGIGRIPGTRFFKAARIEVLRSGPGPFQLDGEALRGERSFGVEVVPRALRVAVPA